LKAVNLESKSGTFEENPTDKGNENTEEQNK
jgi:hypothetical protein